MEQQAILITAYKNYAHLLDIVRYFDDDFKIFIHIDKKSHTTLEILNTIKKVSNVALVSQKYKVNWGGRNHLKSILYLSEEALKFPNISVFHLISGHDYPIKPLAYFKHFYKIYGDKDYFEFSELPSVKWPNGGLDRIIYYNFYDTLDAKKYRPHIFKLVKLQQQLGIKRPLGSKVPKLYGGETWWTLSRETLAYVIDYTHKTPYFFKRLKHSFCSEEIYFHSIILNSDYAHKAINDSLRYIDWSDRNGNFPANLNMDDLEAFKTSNALFARKFEFPISQELKLALMDNLEQEPII
ncbi:beta-1,6-N-acetylglucosaminyltransferase [Aestuariivivens marinum]|uniref:beta-1,6-N-acetylglucosaminyltransferase n=1 Tax=Aestuariivivens marinum TaxID=2913555 RepID=UPI001F57055D|nr:beta-1,6-N-acetylglucosaminyltransferase [Aestuariivivens marinum]